MYLHLGADSIVRERDVIGIFDLDMTTVSQITKDFLYRKEKNQQIVNVATQLPKTFVVTDKKVFISPMASATLKKRIGTLV